MRTLGIVAVYALTLALGLYLTFGPVLQSGFARVQTERGDGMLNHYILEHTWQSVSNRDYRGSLFSPPCFFPQPHTLWYSEHMLGVAPVYWALRLAVSYDVAYQLWQIILDALTFLAFAFAARRLGCPHLLALLGGYLWAFGLVHVDQIKHQQMIARFWMPLAASYAWSFALSPDTRNWNRLLACAFLQCISCVYTGWFLVTGLATFLPLAVALRPGGWRDVRSWLASYWPRALLVGTGWLAAFLAAFVPYMVINADVTRTYAECTGLMPTPSAWFTGPPGTPWEQTTRPFRLMVTDECWLFCGFGIYALMIAAAFGVRRRPQAERPADFALVAAALLTALAWVVLSMAPAHGAHSLWELVRAIPGATAIRCVSRVYVTVYLFGLLASIVWLARVTASWPPARRWVVLGLIAAVLVFEQTGYDPPSFEKPDFYHLVERSAAEVRGADALYVRPAFTDTTGFRSVGVYGEVFAMWVGMKANVPVINGYSGRWPPGDYPAGEKLPDLALTHWLKDRFSGKLLILDPDNPAANRVIDVP